MKAPQLLERAAGHMRDRAATYDKPEGERSMGKTVQAFNVITGRDLSEAEGWLLLQLLKDVRLFQRTGYHADSAEDCIAYAALKAEAKAAEAAPALDPSEMHPWPESEQPKPYCGCLAGTCGGETSLRKCRNNGY